MKDVTSLSANTSIEDEQLYVPVARRGGSAKAAQRRVGEHTEQLPAQRIPPRSPSMPRLLAAVGDLKAALLPPTSAVSSSCSATPEWPRRTLSAPPPSFRAPQACAPQPRLPTVPAAPEQSTALVAPEPRYHAAPEAPAAVVAAPVPCVAALPKLYMSVPSPMRVASLESLEGAVAQAEYDSSAPRLWKLGSDMEPPMSPPFRPWGGACSPPPPFPGLDEAVAAAERAEARHAERDSATGTTSDAEEDSTEDMVIMANAAPPVPVL